MWTLDRLEKLKQADLAGPTGQGIAADGAPMGGDEIVSSELLEDAGEEADREATGLGDVVEQHDRAPGAPCENRQPLQPVLGLPAEEHRSHWTQRVQ
jgi:hypothetical protein